MSPQTLASRNLVQQPWLLLAVLVATLALRALLPWATEMPSHMLSNQGHVMTQSVESSSCEHETSTDSTHLAYEGSCQISCDLATAAAVLSSPLLTLHDSPEHWAFQKPKPAFSRTTPPDHPPPIV